jgi:hypothetical protein
MLTTTLSHVEWVGSPVETPLDSRFSLRLIRPKPYGGKDMRE